MNAGEFTVRRSWSCVAFAAATGGPALLIGGIHPETVLLLCVVLLVLWHGTCRRSDRPLSVPWAAWIGAFAVVLTLVQWLPIEGLRHALAPALAGHVDAALLGTGALPWPGMSVVPGDTAMEAVRALALTVLFIAAAQLSWRVSAAVVAATGAAVALLGFVHDAVGADLIYGFYAPAEASPPLGPWLMTAFVNPNHQSSLLLLGLFAAGALALDQHVLGRRSADFAIVDRHRDRAFAALAALTLQLPALVLSLSRGALVAFLVVSPFALWMGLRQHRRTESTRTGPSQTLLPLRGLLVAGLVGMTLVVAQHGAWAELGTLADITQPDSSAAEKIRLAQDSLRLLDDAGPLGIGRGAYKDTFGAVDPHGTHVLMAHLESIPVALLVEFGVLGGGAIVLAIAGWWLHAFARARGQADRVARRIALLGLAALALHNALDFSLDTLGVAAPTVALAGGLSTARLGVPPRLAGWGGAVLILAGLGLGIWALPHTFAHRWEHDARVITGEQDGAALLPMRPLDGRLHALLARNCARAGAWPEALARAQVATHQRPGVPDGWLIRAAAERQLVGADPSDHSMRAAMRRLHGPVDRDLLQYLLREYPTPSRLAEVVAVDTPAWSLLVAALREQSPAHADAIAQKRSLYAPEDPQPLRERTHFALTADRPSLALHHARLWRFADAGDPAVHVAVARALVRFSPPRLAEARDELQAALEETEFALQADRGVVEEELLGMLVRLGDPQSLTQARALGSQLLARPATRGVQRRREAAVRTLGRER